MTELRELLVIVAVVYLLDCTVLVPRDAAGVLRFAGRWRLQRPFRAGSSWARGVLFGNPLPPLSALVVSEPLPFVLGAGGVTIDRPGEPAPVFLPWRDVGDVQAVDARLEIDGREIATFATRRAASTCAQALAVVRTMDPAARRTQIERLVVERFDHRPVRERLSRFQKETRPLTVATNLLWLGLFGGFVVLVRFPAPLPLSLALLIVVLGWAAAPIATWFVLRRSTWLARPGRGARILAALTPLAAIRHLDLLARELVGDLDPLAVCAALLDAPAFAVAARPRLVALRYGRPTVPAGAEADHTWWRQTLLDRVSLLLRARGIDPESLITAPARESQDIEAWCPSCRAQYRRSADQRCSNDGCVGVSLVAF